MTERLQRILLIFLAVMAVPVGAWAYFAPRSWYDSFPGLGMRWLPPLGPYNEHFCTDAGATYLALAVLAAVAAVLVDNVGVVRVAAATWLTFSVFHLVFHLRMLHVYDTRDAVLNVAALSLPVLIPAALLVLRPPSAIGRRRGHAADRSP